MRPRLRAILLLAAIVLVVSGLLIAGPAHFALHGAGEGHGCEACAIPGISPESAQPDLGPPRLSCLVIELPPAERPTAVPRLLPPARGPPRTL